MNFIFIILVFTFMMLFKIISNLKNDREWNKGLFEEEQSDLHSNDPLLEAYISLGALMIRKDRSSYSEKILYLNSYFARNFPQTHYNFGRSFTDSLKNPVRPRVIAKWLKRKLPKREQRIQIMYFLAGLSTVDGAMNKREIDLLKEMNVLLNLSTKDFESIIAMYTQRNERKSSRKVSKPTLSNVQLAAKIIGVSANASIDEIKKAYRRLVKLHHPDRFAMDSIEQQEIAEQRFIEVQKAYEVLKNRRI